MAVLTCSSCNALLHARLRARLSLLASRRLGSPTRSHSYTVSREPADLAYHWDTVPATPSQLESATAFFQQHKPRKLWTATEWRTQNNKPGGASRKLVQDLLIPEVVFLGRSNVGKSSLLNALLQAPLLNHVGPRPGKTTTMHAWALSASDPITGGAGPGGDMDARLAVLDMPGYGYASSAEWGKEIQTYLRRRRQLRRAFVMIDALHGPKTSDEHMIELLRQGGISYQIIVSKTDRLLATSKTGGNEKLQALYALLRNELVQPKGGRGVLGLGEIIAVGSLGNEKAGFKLREKDMMGVARVRWAVLVAAGLEEWATRKPIIASTMFRSTGDTGTASHWGAGQLSTSTAPVPPTVFRQYGIHDEIFADPPSSQAHQHGPILSASSTPNPTHTHRSPSSARSVESLLTLQGGYRSGDDSSTRTSTSSISATTSSSSSSSSSSLSYNPVGGLAELEAHSSASSLRRKPDNHHSDAKPGSSQSGSGSGKKKLTGNRGRRSKEKEVEKPMQKSEADLNSRGRSRMVKREKREEKEMKRARKVMGDESLDGYYDDDDDHDDHDADFASSSSSSSPPPPPSFHHPPAASTSPASRPAPRLMVGGKGVGGMADLLATSGMTDDVLGNKNGSRSSRKGRSNGGDKSRHSSTRTRTRTRSKSK